MFCTVMSLGRLSVVIDKVINPVSLMVYSSKVYNPTEV